MIMIPLFGSMSFAIYATNLTILYRPQVSAMQDITNEACKMQLRIVPALFLTKAKHIHTIAGKITLNKHTEMLR